MHAYVDGMLDPVHRARIEGYLSHSSQERERVDDYRRQNLGLHRVFDGFGQRTLPQDYHLVVDRVHRSLQRQRRFAAARRTAVAAGVATLAIMAGWNGLERFGREDDPLMSFARQAIDAHGVLLGDGLAGGKFQAADAGKSLFKDVTALPDSVPRRAPDLSAHGLALIGARVVETGDGQAFQLLYGDKQDRRVTLFMGPSLSNHRSASSLVEDAGVTLVYWQYGPLGFSLIGNVGRSEMLRLAASTSESLMSPKRGSEAQKPRAPDSAAGPKPGAAPKGAGKPQPQVPQQAPKTTPIKAVDPSTT